MKPSLNEYALFLAGCLLMLAAIYQKPLGLPEDADMFLILAACVCLLCYSMLLKRRANSRAAHPIPISTSENRLQRLWADKSKRFWLAIAIVAPFALAGPFIAPYTGSTLSFSQEVLSSAITFVLFVAIMWFATRRREASNSAGFPRFGIIMIGLAIIFLLAALLFKR